MTHKIIFLKDKLCLYGNLIGHPVHRHYLMQIAVQKNTLSNTMVIKIIGSNKTHSMINLNGKYFSILIDPLSIIGGRLKSLLSLENKNFHTISTKELNIFEELSENATVEKVEDIADRVISFLLNENVKLDPIDRRIFQSVRLINSAHSLNFSSKEIYEKVGLSESHFYLLFKKHVGIPYRQYVLWRKLYKSTQSILNGDSFTIAAHNGDFTDSAHLSKTFKTNTGLTLSQIFRNKRFIQVIS